MDTKDDLLDTDTDAGLDSQPDGDRQLVTDSDALDEGGEQRTATSARTWPGTSAPSTIDEDRHRMCRFFCRP